MKKSKSFIWLLQLITLCVFSQNKSLSSEIKSKYVNEEGVAQFVTFRKDAKLEIENRSDLLKEFLEASESTSFFNVGSKTDRIGILHETFQQYYNDIPVEFGIYKAHLKNGQLSAINGDYFPVKQINTTPSISEVKAVSLAKQHIKAEVFYESSDDEMGYKGPKPTLVIFPKMENINTKDRLAYKLDMYAEKPLYRADVYIDAHTGDLIFENSKIHNITVGATGATLYNGNRVFRAEQTTGGYRLRQTASGNGIQTFDATNGVSNATDIISSTTTFSNDSVAVQVHWGTERTHQYFAQKHSRNSFDGNGALIKSYITPQTPNANANWMGDVFHYSIGNGSNLGPLTSLDIIGHEFTHAVGDYSANLIYSNQSGALDESFADIFGEMVEHFVEGSNDWLCGADVFAGGIRSMSDPKSKLQPDTYRGIYWQDSYIPNNNDNYGVHTNSGVHNKWFYLLAVGGSGTNDNGYSYSVNGIGIEKAAEIAYRNLTWYLTPTSNYHYACESSMYAANQLFGPNSPEAVATAQAWRAVGLLIPQTDYIPPTTPLNLVATNTTSNNVISGTLSWDASTDNVGVLGYNIYRNGSLIAVSNTTNYNVPQNMVSNTMYDFRVQAFDAEGRISALSNIDSIWYDTIDPTAPTNLTSSNTTENSTELSWTTSTDNFGVAGYELYQTHQGTTTVIPVTSTSYTVQNLYPSENYSFKVKAIDTSGNESNFSNTESVTTLATCASGNVTLTINFDWYPEETSWDIRDANNLVVASDGNYPISWSPPPPAIYSIALSSGFYTLNMYDSMGDGIWSLTPGIEGYILESNVIIASGSETNPLANTVTTPFCIDTSVNRTSLNSVKGTNNNYNPSGAIYPNPVLNRLYVKHLENLRQPYVILDMTGKVIIKGKLDSVNSIDVNQLLSGLYILEIIDKDETMNYKFIKK